MWGRLKKFFQRREIDDGYFAELESTLLAADVGPALTGEWVALARREKTATEVQRVVRDAMLARLANAGGTGVGGESAKSTQTKQPNLLSTVGVESPQKASATSSTLLPLATTDSPAVVMILGVNGAGKTTTVAKVARFAALQGRKPLLVAGDTFRAAAIEQLQIWGERLSVPVIASQTGADSAAVAFDGIAAAKARGFDLVLVDTAGRLHTKIPLMDELAKVKRVMGKALPGAPHATWCILDATTGQNAIAQVEQFHKTIGLTGLILTKLDGSAKAGAVFSIAHALAIPILFTGHGEQIEDLREFSQGTFITNLLGDPAE